MKINIFLPVCLLLCVACNKDKFKTEPQVEVKSISPGTVSSGNVITLEGKYTDDEGDVDSMLIVYKWYNGNTAVTPNIGDTFRFAFSRLNLPPATRQADIRLDYEYNTFNFPDIVKLPGIPGNDTSATFGLILIDKAGNRSNYSESEKIRLKRP